MVSDIHIQHLQKVGGSLDVKIILGLPWWLSGKEFTCQCRRHGFDPWSGKIPHAMKHLGLCAMTTEACMPRAQAPQEKPQQ